MSALPPTNIIKAIEDAFMESVASVVFLSKPKEQPRRFYVTTANSSFPVWIYIWTLTHGGGAARPRDEYRIQLTSVAPPLLENPDGPTLLLGYEPSLKCFAGFDLRKHRHFSTNSPSIQININVLRDALRDGFSFQRKGNNETAIAFRPDNMIAYALNSDSLHRNGVGEKTTDILSMISRFENVPDAKIDELSPDRRRIVVKVSHLVRDSAFRKKVIVAYDRKCCVTGLQLKLIDAAHILPVGAPDSPDIVNNGLCLSPTYHRAYDNGLIFLSEDRKMQINQQRKQELLALGLAGGLAAFEAPLGREIFLPCDRTQWPATKLIKLANQYRLKG